MEEKISRDKIIKFFRRAGWYENRKVDISKLERYYQECSYPMFESTKKFFQEFYKLKPHVFNSNSLNDDYCIYLQEIDFNYDFVHFLNQDYKFKIDNSLKHYKMNIEEIEIIDNGFKYHSDEITTNEPIQYIGNIGFVDFQMGELAETFIGESGKIYHIYTCKVYDNLFDMVYDDTIQLKNSFEYGNDKKFKVF